jgi:acetyl esterase/lipase
MPLVRRNFTASIARFTSSVFAQEQLRVVVAQRRWTETDIQIPVRDGSTIQARVYNPDANSGAQVLPPPIIKSSLPPVAVMVHGGGWCMGHLDTEEFLCQYLCARLNMVVVNVAYRLCPDVPFPVPVFDVYDAMQWVEAWSSSCPSCVADRDRFPQTLHAYVQISKLDLLLLASQAAEIS